jgi:hypothetical protein
MRSRLLSWILLLYMAIDLANPFVPGAVRFTPEEGLVWVEGMPHQREQGGGENQGTTGRRSPRDEVVSFRRARAPDRRTAPAPRLADWLTNVRTGDPPARDFPPPATDDH